MAGEVKAKGDRRRARSDWMSIEQKRGISVSTSVMTFDYGGCTFNLLDTPGHEDFSEDTYRTLTAVDSAVMVIDAAKGIEAQTLKLFEVCRLRDMPIITFINKMDREARDPFELLDEIADRLALDVSPMNWPIGMGQNFRGVAERSTGDVLLMKQDAKGIDSEERVPRLSNTLGDRVDPRQLEQLDAEMELVEGALEPFDLEAYRAGNLTPVFFGSALRTFGIRALLDQLAAAAPSPRPQPAEPIDREARRAAGGGLRLQGPGQHGPEAPRPRRLRAHLLGPLPARHEAEDGPPPKAHRHRQSDLLLRPGPWPRRGSLPGRHHRRAQSRPAPGRRRALRGRGPTLHRHSELRARRS